MKNLGLNEIREMYLSFFENKEHLRHKSFPLIPQNDKSILFTVAGMAPLKPYFTGKETPPKSRMTTCQKCIRTEDLENIGKTPRHGTFFEMLGNFSFGDYFKEEAILWAYEFMTEKLELDMDKVWVSVYKEDDEAYDIWKNKIGFDESKIVKLGKEDNFWEHGDGPCGPCSEIFYDMGEENSCGDENCAPGCECDRYLEFWNLVFTQFNSKDGEYTKLESPSIDTGMGLERIASILQNVKSIFDVDTFKAIRDKVCEISGKEYEVNKNIDWSIRVVADHARAMTFMLADGVMISNEGRGYVLRRIIRRAARHGKLLGVEGNFLEKIVNVVIEMSKHEYTEISEKKDYIIKSISTEEDRFSKTLEQGLAVLEDYSKHLKAGDTLSGDKAFKLYDTYGFPVDLTMEILEDKNVLVDEDGFKKEMELQKKRARDAREETNYAGAADTVFNKLSKDYTTEFCGYTNLEIKEEIKDLIKGDEIVSKLEANDKGFIMLAKTPFYAESGGQVGDKGIIETSTGVAKVEDCKKITGSKFSHVVTVLSGEIKKGDIANLQVGKEVRESTSRNHTATHILQKALRIVLGDHVEQSGSYVNGEKLRFDFTHFEAMTKEEISKVENIINEKILEAIDVNVFETSIDEARELGAMALFGEKYGDVVRVVKASDYSIELCGGTHVSNTSKISLFKITSENGVAAGVRRIEAVTGKNAIDYFRNQEEKVLKIESILKNKDVVEKVEATILELKEKNKEIDKLKAKLATSDIDDVVKNKENINGIDLVIYRNDDLEMNELRNMGDIIKNKLGEGVVVGISGKNQKVSLISMATDGAIKNGAHAGNIIREIAAIVGGGGGGRPNSAQAGGKDVTKINDAIKEIKEILLLQLKG